jgi:HEAT repeat protein
MGLARITATMIPQVKIRRRIRKKLSHIMKTVENTCTDITLYTVPANVVKLINALSDEEDYSNKKNARITLELMGKNVIPQLHKLLTSDNSLLRMEAAKIIKAIADRRSIPLLITLLDDIEFDIRWTAAEGLIRIGRKSITPLLKAIRDGKSSLLLNKRAHQVLNKLLLETEKQQLSSLMLSLDDYLGLIEVAPVEAQKALKTYKKFSDF